MQVSTKLFNQQQLKQFSSTTEDLQDLQNKIGSGQNILRASDDPLGSVELSGLNVVKSQIEQFERNVNSASDRLNLLDKNLENLSSNSFTCLPIVKKPDFITDFIELNSKLFHDELARLYGISNYLYKTFDQFSKV